MTTDTATVDVATDTAPMVMEKLWCTCISRTHLRAHASIRNVSALNEQLSALIVSDHGAFARMHGNDVHGDATALNDLFFAYQTGAGDAFNDSAPAVQARVNTLQHRRSAAFEAVTRAAATLADAQLSAWGVAQNKGTARRLQAWASVLRDGARHTLHVHDDATLTVVYYVRAAKRDGALRLWDARGPRAPFDGVVEVLPQAGEMVAFPGW
ncbi:unnamed protein product, partial [Agarophyton chilense]